MFEARFRLFPSTKMIAAGKGAASPQSQAPQWRSMERQRPAAVGAVAIAGAVVGRRPPPRGVCHRRAAHRRQDAAPQRPCFRRRASH
jgi:hypothetical protein